MQVRVLSGVLGLQPILTLDGMVEIEDVLFENTRITYILCFQNRLMKYTKELLEALVKESVSVAEVLRKLGKQPSGNTHLYISKRIKELGIDTSHFLGRGANRGKKHKGGTPKKTWQEILVLRQDNKRELTLRLRRALIEYGRKYECENLNCSVRETWLDREITLHVDHLNGNWRDNRPKNLRFLCPNCHSQTDNYCGSKGYTGRISMIGANRKQYKPEIMLTPTNQNFAKKRSYLKARKVERPSKEDLQKLVWEKPTIHIAKDFGVSDKAIEKWCKAYGIQKPPRGYWAKQQSIQALVAERNTH